MALAPGTRIAAYEIRSLVGSGGMGEVYRACDTRLNRDVALKVLRPEVKNDADRLARLRQEAQAVASLEHPHICRLYDVGPDYLVIEYLEGRPLAGPLPPDRAVEYGLQILDALSTAHAKGVIHRDLKPANILVTDRGVKLLDFGIATAPQLSASSIAERETHVALTETGVLMGTPAFMAPELWQGKKADARSDIYAFGAVLNEMLTGTRPDREHARAPRTKMEAVAAKCLVTNPDDRYQSAAAVASALAAASRPRHTIRWLTAAAAFLLVAGVAFIMWQRRAPQSPPLTDQDVLVVADFDNQTADAVFGTALRQALAFQLQESPFLKAMDDAQVRQALAGANRPSDSKLTADVARDICVREQHKATLEGSITSVGSTYLIALQAVNCATGETIAREQTTADKKETVVTALASATTAMRRRLGESLSTITVEERAYGHRVTTSSLDALQAFYLGDAEFTTSGNPRAVIQYYERAVELDPNFAMALGVLGVQYGNLRDAARQREYLTRAFALADRVSERERLFITSEYYAMNGDEEKATSLREVLVRTFPRDPMLHYNLAISYENRGEWEKAYRESEAAIRTGPKIVQGYQSAMTSALALNRVDDYRAAARRALKAGLNSPAIHAALLYDAFAMDDAQARDAELEWFKRLPDDPRPLREQGNDALARGQLTKAADFLERADRVVRQLASVPPRYAREFAEGAAVLGDCTGHSRRERTPLIDALCGSNEVLRSYTASRAAQDGPDAYARGVERLKASRPVEAAAIFDAMIERRVPNWGPEYPAALVGRARAAVATGDMTMAQARYEQFFALWTNADVNAVLLLAARREFAALK